MMRVSGVLHEMPFWMYRLECPRRTTIGTRRSRLLLFAEVSFSGDARMRLAGTPSHGTTVDHGQPSGMSAPATLPPVIDSALNEYIGMCVMVCSFWVISELTRGSFLAQLKSNIHYFLNFMATPQYRAQVMELIERERVSIRVVWRLIGRKKRQERPHFFRLGSVCCKIGSANWNVKYQRCKKKECSICALEWRR